MTAKAIIRPAVAGDLDRLLELGEARRRQYAEYQPVFWRPAIDAIDQHRPYLAKLIEDDAVITVVADTGGTLTGFAVGTIVTAPPVYDPGGSTCVVDDFVVGVPEQLAYGRSQPAGRASAHRTRARSGTGRRCLWAPRRPREDRAGTQRAKHRLRVVGRSARQHLSADFIPACRSR